MSEEYNANMLYRDGNKFWSTVVLRICGIICGTIVVIQIINLFE